MLTIPERKKRWADLYENKRRTAVIFNSDYGTRPWPYRENMEQRFEWALNAYRIQMETVSWLDAETIPYLYPYTGTEIFAEALGCKVHLPGNDMPFALPFINDASDLKKVKIPRLEDSTVQELFDLADRLKKEEPDGILRIPDIQSPFDIAALMWEKIDFFAAMIEEPNAVKELILMVEEFLVKFLDTWFGRYGKDFVAHWPDYYMPYGITLSEDECGAISPDMFNEFCIDSLNRLSKRYGGLMGMHCCADAVHQWDNFKNIHGLKLLNFGQPEEVIKKTYEYFPDLCHMHGKDPDDAQKKKARVVVQEWVHGKQETIEKLAAIREAYGEE